MSVILSPNNTTASPSLEEQTIMVSQNSDHHCPSYLLVLNTHAEQTGCMRNGVRSVMVLKKLGDELMPQFHSVVQYLGAEQGMQVVVEPHEYEKMVLLMTCVCQSKSTDSTLRFGTASMALQNQMYCQCGCAVAGILTGHS